jgi:signal transduction histidine kinase
MSLHQAPLQGLLALDMTAPHATSTRVRGRRLWLMRLGWTLLATINLVVFFVSIPVYYAQLFVLCSSPRQGCAIGQLTLGNVLALHHLGITLDSYATYTLAVSLFASSIFLIVGLVLFWRRSDDWMAVLASSVLLIFAAVHDVRASAISLPDAPVLNMLLMIVGTLILGVGGYCGLGLLFSLFPTGRPIPRYAWLLVFLWLIQIVPWALPPDSPYQVLNWPPLLFAGEQLLLWGTSLSVQLYRYSLASDHVQRQQSKWLIFGFALALLLDIPYLGLPGLFPVLAAASSPYLLLNATAIELFHVSVPLAIGFAILRYRLWDIDLIINRTLVYGTLTVSVIGLYVLVVVGLGTLLQAQGNVFLSLLATGIIAVLFQPLHERLQREVNHLMYGERDEPYQVISRLGQRLEVTLAPEAVLPTIVATVAQALKLPYAAISLKQEGEDVLTASSGRTADELTRLPLVYQGEYLGDLWLAPRARGEPFSSADRALLTDLARQAGIAVHTVRLTTDLQRITHELQRSRTGLVTAREEERRRLRRDLHDGLGSVLASLNWGTGAIRSLLSRDPVAAETLVVEQQHTIQAAIADIRRLVYDLRPPALDELGLGGAIRERAVQQSATASLDGAQGPQIDVCAPDHLPALPAAIEVAAYRIVQEALANVVRHAQAHRCCIHLMWEQDMLHVEVTDDGVGLPERYRAGVGLLSMRERAVELGGTCEVVRLLEGGTRVRACLPLLKEEEGAAP